MANTSSSKALELTVVSAKLVSVKNKQFMGVGHMDPYCIVTISKKGNDDEGDKVMYTERSEIDPDDHKNPVWNFKLSKPFLLPDDGYGSDNNNNVNAVGASFRNSLSSATVHIQVCNDSSMPMIGVKMVVMGELEMSLKELVDKSHLGSGISLKKDMTQPPEKDNEGTSTPSITGLNLRSNFKKAVKSPFGGRKKGVSSDASQLSLYGGSVLLQTKIVEMTDNQVTMSIRNMSSCLEQGGHVLPHHFDFNKTTRMGVSGGTAPFFHLYLSEEGKQWLKETRPGETSETYYLGKDLSRAEDELSFYEKLLEIQRGGGDGGGTSGLAELLPFTFDYPGILRCPNPDPDVAANGDAKMNMLVLRNLRDGISELRLLDLKMGQQTAQAKWRGKSRLHAYRQQWLVDGTTNSTAEGYRLEGFDGMPVSLESMDPLLDLAVQCIQKAADEENKETEQKSYKTLFGREATEKEKKKAQRVMFQHMAGAEILMHFINVVGGTTNSGTDTDNTEEHFAPVEVTEIVLHEVVSQMVRLARVLNLSIQLPQKWIGSSVALGYDVGDLTPPRFTTLDSASGRHIHTPYVDNAVAVRQKVICSVFDWGRSELLVDQTEYEALSEEDKADRIKFWGYYKGGINTLCFNAAKTYCNSFGNSQGWSSVTITVMDFDSMSKDDFMGQVTLILPEKPYAPSPYELDSSKQEEGCVIADGKARTYVLSALSKESRRARFFGGSGNDLADTTNGYGSIDAAVSWWKSPSSSRLKGAWRIRIIKGAGLKIKDNLTNSSDPYCVVTASSVAGAPAALKFKQITSVQIQTLNPQWGGEDGNGETIDVPVSGSSQYMLEAVAVGGLGELANSKLYSMLCNEDTNVVGGGSPDADASYIETAGSAMTSLSASLTGALSTSRNLQEKEDDGTQLERWTKILTTK
jgi:hypothetical protein